ncbi:hypothetical protein Tsubulata_008462 [Turnera subulata]|uniref:DUF4283 domain-containing protein n=1 Tax=Turnera subulata TaxID=218843 RepID=A0A9Q0JNN4_9ROSI|nr:hypothetical protein Tsubulata_008462 [Turnera subulata]
MKFQCKAETEKPPSSDSSSSSGSSSFSVEPLSLQLPEDWDSGRSFSKHVFVAKIVAEKRFSATVLRSICSRAWALNNRVDVKELGYNIFLFSFEDPDDHLRIMLETPWSVAGHHLVIKECHTHLPLHAVDFSISECWVQVHGLCPSQLSKENGWPIGNLLGSCMAVDTTDDNKLSYGGILCLKLCAVTLMLLYARRILVMGRVSLTRRLWRKGKQVLENSEACPPQLVNIVKEPLPRGEQPHHTHTYGLDSVSRCDDLSFANHDSHEIACDQPLIAPSSPLVNVRSMSFDSPEMVASVLQQYMLFGEYLSGFFHQARANPPQQSSKGLDEAQFRHQAKPRFGYKRYRPSA